MEEEKIREFFNGTVKVNISAAPLKAYVIQNAALLIFRHHTKTTPEKKLCIFDFRKPVVDFFSRQGGIIDLDALNNKFKREGLYEILHLIAQKPIIMETMAKNEISEDYLSNNCETIGSLLNKPANLKINRILTCYSIPEIKPGSRKRVKDINYIILKPTEETPNNIFSISCYTSKTVVKNKDEKNIFPVNNSSWLWSDINKKDIIFAALVEKGKKIIINNSLFIFGSATPMEMCLI